MFIEISEIAFMIGAFPLNCNGENNVDESFHSGTNDEEEVNQDIGLGCETTHWRSVKDYFALVLAKNYTLLIIVIARSGATRQSHEAQKHHVS